jgi:NodT family efflux transporter outer membrane factor (OMF) lipoprotein
MKKYINIFIGALLFSSCGVYTSYHPKTEVDENIFGEGVVVKDTTTLASLSWRELFTDPLLQELIQKAIDRNVDLETARLNVEQAKAALTTSKLAYLPSLNLTNQATIGSFDGSKAAILYQLPLAASWDVDIFGRVRNAKEKAKAAYQQSQAYQQAVQASLIANVANTYYSLLTLQRQIEVMKITQKSWNEMVASTASMMKAGMSNSVALARVKSTAKSIEKQLINLEDNFKIVEGNLCLLLKEPVHTVTIGRFQEEVFPQQLHVGVPAQLLSNRPDVQAAEYSLKQYFYGVNAARSAFYPKLTLSGTAGWTNNPGGAVVNPAKILLSAIGSLTVPIFNKGANIANLKIAKAKFKTAQLNFEQTLLKAGKEVNDALVSYQDAVERLKLNDEQIVHLETALRDAKLLMKHSTGTYLDVLTAQQSLLQVQQEQVGVWLSKAQSVVQLYHALGGGTK